MWAEATIGTIAVAVGSIGTALTLYFKNRGTMTNGNGKRTPIPTICSEHKAMNQTVIGIKEDVKEVKDRVHEQSQTISDVARTTFRIQGLLEGMRDAK